MRSVPVRMLVYDGATQQIMQIMWCDSREEEAAMSRMKIILLKEVYKGIGPT